MKIVAKNSLTLSNVNDGKTAVVHWAYSDNADGTGFTTTDNGQRYIGHYSDYTQANSTDKTKYRWADRWAKIDVGTRNLWIQSKATGGFVTESLPDNHITGQKKCYKLTNNTTLEFNIEPDFSPRLYQKVTFSAWIKYENVVQGVNTWNTFNCFKHTLVRKNSSTGAVTGTDYPTLAGFTGTSDWKYISYTYDYSTNKSYDQLKTPIRFNLESVISGSAWVTGIMIQFGTVATGHVWAPEDIDAKIDDMAGIIVSSVAPASPQIGQLWQDTSTTPQLVKKWTGSEWVIWEFYAQNLIADNISTISLNLGDMTGGTVKLMADVYVNGTLKKHGIYQSKLGLLSSGPSLATPSTISNSQMGVANLNKGELRFIVTNYTENLKDVQEAGMSDQNNAFIKFDSYDNGKDIMTIGSSGDIVFKGITSQDTPWIAMLNGTYYKNMFSRVYISYSIQATSTANISLGVLPVGLRPFRGLHLTANAWGTTISNDRHIEVRTTGEVTLYNPANGASYDGEVSFTL